MYKILARWTRELGSRAYGLWQNKTNKKKGIQIYYNKVKLCELQLEVLG